MEEHNYNLWFPKMISFSEKDKEYINRTKGVIVARGIHDHLNVLRKKFDNNAPQKIADEMKKLGYNQDFLHIKETESMPTSVYMAFLLAEKQLFNLDDEGVRELGRGAAKISFLLRFASRLLISPEILRKNANFAWKKYFKEGGELKIVELDMENRRLVGEIYDFVGHPVHCTYLEGYFSEILFFVIGKKGECREEKCVFKGDEFHRFVLTWD
jgi:predicted hydrocarbon binding protein